jgi:hypothetical protein
VCGTDRRVFYPTAALVIEIVLPGDETWEKLKPYAQYVHLKRRRLLELGAGELAELIDWR